MPRILLRNSGVPNTGCSLFVLAPVNHGGETPANAPSWTACVTMATTIRNLIALLDPMHIFISISISLIIISRQMRSALHDGGSATRFYNTMLRAAMLLSILSLVCGEDSQLGVARKVKRTYPYEQHTRPERGRGDAEGTRSEPATQKFGEGLQDGSHTTLLSMKECEERFRRGELGEGVVKRGSETTLATLRTYCQNVMKAFQLRMDERAIQDEMNHVDFGTAEFDQRLKAIQPTGKMRTSLLAGGSQTGEAGLNGKYPPAEDGNATTPAVFTSLASLGVYGHKNGTFLLSMDMVSYNQRARIRRINARTGKVSTVDSGTAPSHAPVGTSLVIVKHKSARQVVYFSAALKTQDPVSLQATDLLSGTHNAFE